MSKKLKYILTSIIFCILIVAFGKFFRYILVDDTTSYTRITFHEMYEQDNIDILFVGSSHCYRTFIPEILDDRLGGNTFNAGTSAQLMDGSYMVIKEAAKYNNIKHIYLEVYYSLAFKTNEDRNQMTQTYIISDYLKPSIDKVRYLLNASSKEHYVNSFIPARRNWYKFFDADYITNLILTKQTKDYKDYEYTYVTGKTERYAGKGYVENNAVIDKWNFFSDSGWEEIDINNISDDWLHALETIIEFCENKGIKLTLVSAPMPCFNLIASKNYDAYVNFIRGLIAEKNVEYYDFNLCKEEYFPNDSTLFYDISHVNSYGAKKFSNLFADLVNGNIIKEDLFWDSYKDKMKNMNPAVYGISYCDQYDENGRSIRNCKIVATSHENLEFKVVLRSDGEKEYVIQDFSPNKYFSIIPNEHGVYNISYRLADNLKIAHSLDIAY